MQRLARGEEEHLRREKTARVSARFLWPILPSLPRHRRPYGLGDWHHSSAVCVQQRMPGKRQGLGLTPKTNFSPLLSGDPHRVPPSRAYLLSPCWIEWADIWILALYLPMVRLIFEMAGDERDGQRLQLKIVQHHTVLVRTLRLRLQVLRVSLRQRYQGRLASVLRLHLWTKQHGVDILHGSTEVTYLTEPIQGTYYRRSL